MSPGRFARIRAGSLSIVGCLVASLSLASEGVVELDHSCAIQVGCASGDGPGYPITVSRGASYRLTSNLVVPDEDTTAIEIGASSVSLDLNGFTIIRAACVDVDISESCVATSGSGAGVAVTDVIAIEGVSVRNGAVVGMGSGGVALGRGARVVDVRTRWNRGDGISVQAGSVITGCQSSDDGGTSIRLIGAGVIANNTSSFAGQTGIGGALGANIAGNAVLQSGSIGIATFGATVRSNAVVSSGQVGIQALAHAVVSENVVAGSGINGIVVGDGSTVSRSVVSGSAVTGIAASGGSGVDANVVRDSGAYELDLDATSTYRDNTIGSGGTLGTVDGGLDMGGNSCGGTTSCP